MSRPTRTRSGAVLSMLCAAAHNGWLDRDAVVMEALLGFKRAGADAILTYFAEEVAAALQRD